MEWRDHGILLTLRRHGEGAAIIDVFTEHHGRHAGIVHGGASRKKAPVLQPGAQLDLLWRARLQEHLGSYQAEPLRSRAAAALSLVSLKAQDRKEDFPAGGESPAFYCHDLPVRRHED